MGLFAHTFWLPRGAVRDITSFGDRKYIDDDMSQPRESLQARSLRQASSKVMQRPASPSRDGALWAAIPIPMGHVFEADDRLSNTVTAGGRLLIAPGTRGIRATIPHLGINSSLGLRVGQRCEDARDVGISSTSKLCQTSACLHVRCSDTRPVPRNDWI